MSNMSASSAMVFECPTCFESFSPYGAQEPRVLVQCGHTICKTCLARIFYVRNSLTCPICRAAFPSGVTSYESCPRNLLVVGQIDNLLQISVDGGDRIWAMPLQYDEEEEDKRRSLYLHLQLLTHVSTCTREKKCSSENCKKMKGFLAHEVGCHDARDGRNCSTCNKVKQLLQVHAKRCTLPDCKVPRCLAMRKLNSVQSGQLDDGQYPLQYLLTLDEQNQLVALQNASSTNTNDMVIDTTVGQPHIPTASESIVLPPTSAPVVSISDTNDAAESKESAPNDETSIENTIKEFQLLLVLLRHASKCSSTTIPCEKCGNDCTNKKRLWNHLTECRDPYCRDGDCVLARFLLSHYGKCSSKNDDSCLVCEPIRKSVRRVLEVNKVVETK